MVVAAKGKNRVSRKVKDAIWWAWPYGSTRRYLFQQHNLRFLVSQEIMGIKKHAKTHQVSLLKQGRVSMRLEKLS